MSNPPLSSVLSLPVTERDHIRGKKDAPLTLLQYGDYECDYCGRVYPIVDSVLKHFGDRVRFVFRHFPHANIHPHASIAAQAAEAAGMQGKFWEMHDLLYENQDNLATADLTHYALKIGLEPYHFEADLASERFAHRVAADHKGGVESGVKKTPTFFINDVRHDGPPEYQVLVDALSISVGP